MPAPSLLTCTAAAPSAPTPKRRGNPRLHLVPRCGAKTRSGQPCLAPAIHGKQRCRMHGGRSTGPRTDSGLARVSAAHTIHGRYDAVARAQNRHIVSFSRRGRMFIAVAENLDRLPAEWVERFNQRPPELTLPPHPHGAGISAAQDRAMRQWETAALAPWKQAVAEARRTPRPSAGAAARDSAQGPHAPISRVPFPIPVAEVMASLGVNLRQQPLHQLPPVPAAGPAATARPAQEPHAPIPATPRTVNHGQQPMHRETPAPRATTAAQTAVTTQSAQRPRTPIPAAVSGRHQAAAPARPGAIAVKNPRHRERAAPQSGDTRAPSPAAPCETAQQPHAPIPGAPPPAAAAGQPTGHRNAGREARRWYRQHKNRMHQSAAVPA